MAMPSAAMSPTIKNPSFRRMGVINRWRMNSPARLKVSVAAVRASSMVASAIGELVSQYDA